MNNEIIVTGARVHNLKNITVSLPRNKFIVITGLSGSGKSSLAFDTIYAEGQRRYVESLSAYARQFLDQLDKPDVDRIDGLSPAISIDQKTASHNPRSTVGTVTEIYDYMRLLYASVGTPHCPNCGNAVSRQSAQEIVDHVIDALQSDQSVTVFSPLISGKKGEHQNLFDELKQDGFSRVRVNGTIKRLDEPIPLEKQKTHSVELVVDRMPMTHENHTRLFESVETAIKQSGGTVLVETTDESYTQLFSENFSCPDCNVSLAEISPRLFSFNSPYGACPTCNGLGDTQDFDEDLVIEGGHLPVRLCTQKVLNLDDTIYGRRLEGEVDEHGFNMDIPFSKLTKAQKDFFLFGRNGDVPAEDLIPKKDKRRRWGPKAPRYWEGVIGNLRRRYKQTNSEGMRFYFRQYMSAKPCETCKGQRLKSDALAVTIQKKNIAETCLMPIENSVAFFEKLTLTDRQEHIAKQLLKEIRERLGFLNHVGLGYIGLDRKANTLSGGEMQRIRLATQIGSGLTGVLYVLDEPSIGLHQRDNDRLLETLHALRDLGNTLIVVEHDEDTIRQADYVIDIGPEAGRNGGHIMFAGDVPKLLKDKKSITAKFLNGIESIPVPKTRRQPKKQQYITLKGATENNLKNITLKLPLEQMVVVTGVSGSGKSTLITGILHKILMRQFYNSKERPGKYKTVEGLSQLDKVITIDQSPIGRTPRSNPATYTGIFTPIREIFAKTREARIRGYKPGRFSFNVKGGRCESCQGDGMVKIEMHFLSDVYVTCDVCKSKRYNENTLEVRFKGFTISDVLKMTVNQAVEVFANIPQVATKLQTLQDVGLGYVALGQSATTLSGGEAQRIKISKELGKRSTGRTMYLLDEPTTGLHFADVKRLLGVLNRLTDGGNTVLIIEHNLDVIKCADHIIDLGPEGGSKGGHIIAQGTPEQIAKVKGSYTGKYLKPLLKKSVIPAKAGIHHNTNTV